MRTLLLATLVLSAATSALAQDKPAEPPKAKKICRTEPAQTGQMMPHRACKTADQWAAADEHRKNHPPVASDVRHEGLGSNNEGMRPPM